MSSVVISGNTSGTITLDAPAVAGTTTLTLPATSGTVITTGNIPTGSVVQVVNANLTSKVSTTSTSYIDTGLTATITPSSTSNKILVIVSLNSIGASSNITFFKILRASTVLINNTDGGEATTYTAFAAAFNGSGKGSHGGLNYLDSPASTSALVYKVQMLSDNASSTATLNNWNLDNNAGAVSTITLMEIKG